MVAPWSPAMAGEAEIETNILSPRATAPGSVASRTIDATPSEADLQADE